MKTKKYYESLLTANRGTIVTLEEAVKEKDQALRFLMADPNPYRVEIKPDNNIFTNYGAFVDFEYVDEFGKYHSIRRKLLKDKVTCISASKEAAIISYSATIPVTYWILQKAAEVFAEIPEAYLCHRNEKICEIKEC
jgi:hypothetical protein